MGRERVLDTLQRISNGEAAEDLVPVLYSELKRLARAMRARLPRGSTIQTTELVHEAYLDLVGDRDPGWNGRAHFFGSAARAMREIVIAQARRKARAKHGGGFRRVQDDRIDLPAELPSNDAIAIHEALVQLEQEDPRKGEIVNLRFFAGLTTEETAEVLKVSTRTVEREWRYTRAWLFDQLRDGAGPVG